MSHTPWSYRKFAQSDEDLAQMETMRRNGMSIWPTLMLNNEGQAIVMQGDKRIAVVDSHSKVKRGEGHKSECEIRDANARLIAATPDLLAALEDLIVNVDAIAHPKRLEQARAAIAKAKGEA